MANTPDVMLWLDDHRGVYIPRDFATSFADRAKSVSGVSHKTWSILEAGPDHEWYWEAWTEVCDNATITDERGNRYFVYQDGACWLVPHGMEWNEELGGFAWPSDDDEEC